MKTYTIRPLEWKPLEGALAAYTTFGNYSAWGDCWCFAQSHIAGVTTTPADSLEAAKAACQRDFEKRLAKWLVEDTRLQAIREVVKEQTP